MSPAHWDRLPPKAKPKRAPPRKSPRGTWRCMVPGCAAPLLEDFSWPMVERHLDTHGGGRAEIVLRSDES